MFPGVLRCTGAVLGELDLQNTSQNDHLFLNHLSKNLKHIIIKEPKPPIPIGPGKSVFFFTLILASRRHYQRTGKLLVGWLLAGLLAGWLLSGSWLAGCLADGWMAGWLAGQLACWLAGCFLAGRLAGSARHL